MAATPSSIASAATIRFHSYGVQAVSPESVSTRATEMLPFLRWRSTRKHRSQNAKAAQSYIWSLANQTSTRPPQPSKQVERDDTGVRVVSSNRWRGRPRPCLPLRGARESRTDPTSFLRATPWFVSFPNGSPNFSIIPAGNVDCKLTGRKGVTLGSVGKIINLAFLGRCHAVTI